ncbi:MAG: transcription-repair coupling factor, partial [Eubacteriaceae bacterium]|nr:transcription-repair coupling factor [Eubacteriaceae bacterium]
DSIVKNAIYKELSQGGQVYYIYNKVKGIELKAQALQTLIPDAKIAYAHGQMAETKLEKLMADFIERKYDVFLSTTIVENGLDIPTANTMIIEDAHKMGLSQLYQLKGRVGRSDKQAYAYITYPQNKILPQDAEKRLKAIKDFTSFGSGHKIALRDLQIRGAGNILGMDQSGHFGDVGYEMYSRILKEVILQAKGIKAEEDKYTEIDLLVSAYVPEHYIASSSQRMELYKDIASIESKQQMEELKLSLADRYGKIPIATDNLLLIGYLKNLAQRLDIEKIKQDKNVIKIIPYNTFDASVLTKLYKNFTFKVITTKKQSNEIHFNNTTLLSMPEYVKKVLESIYALKNIN